MKRFLLALVACAACTPVSADLILNVPSQTLTRPAVPYTFSEDLAFLVTAPNVSQALVGYDLSLKVTTTGGSGFSIVGVGTGSDQPAGTAMNPSNPNYAVQTNPTDGTVYTFSDFTLGTPGTIANGSGLVRVKMQLQPDAVGTFHVDVYSNASSPLDTMFYSGTDIFGNPIAINGMTFQGGTITILVPEPSTFILLCACAFGTALVAVRRRLKSGG
jgi:hypothetical protein